jgi:GTPase SAR1 family protein
MSKALDLTSYYEAKAAKKEREPDLNFHVIVVGDKQVGKSAIVQQLCFNKWRDLEKEALERAKRDGGKGKRNNQPPVKRRIDNWRWDAGALEVYWDPKQGAHWEEDIDMDAFDRIEGNKLLRIVFLDCVDKYPTEISRRAYYRGAQSAVIVYSVDDRNSYTSACGKWVEEVEAYCLEKGRGRYGDINRGKPGHALAQITGYAQGYETFVCGILIGNKLDREEEKRQDEIEKEEMEKERKYEPITDSESDIAVDLGFSIESEQQQVNQGDERLYQGEDRGDESVATVTDSIFDQRHTERNGAVIEADSELREEWHLIFKGVTEIKENNWAKPFKEILLPGHREVSSAEAQEFSFDRGFLFHETSPKIDSDINRNRVKNTVTGVYTVKSTVKDAANLIIDALMAAYQENPTLFEPQTLVEDQHYTEGETWKSGQNEEGYNQNESYYE